MIVILSIVFSVFVVCVLGLPLLSDNAEAHLENSSDTYREELIASELQHELLTGKIDEHEYATAKQELGLP